MSAAGSIHLVHRSALLQQWSWMRRLLVLASAALAQGFVRPGFFARPSPRQATAPAPRSFATFSSVQRRVADHHRNVSSDRKKKIETTTTSTPLFGISEWRDTFFDFPGAGDDRRLGTETGGPPKKVNLLPFPFQEVLLQGETKQLRLYEERFLKLFDDSMENHGGVVAMGLLADSGIIQTVPLCEIEAYNRMEGFGIFITIRVVGRANVLEIVQQEPFIQAVVVELADRLPPNLELPNLVASNIENYMLLLSSMEYRLEQAKKEDAGIKDPQDYDKVMQQRIKLAKLEDTFYEDGDDDGDDEEEEEGGIDADDAFVDRRKRFRRAYEIALETDTQGYQTATGPSERTPQELTALSWAAFCSELLPDTDAPFRVQALCSETLFDRLKVASAMLQRKKKLLRARMEKAGVRLSREDLDDSSDGITEN